MLDKLRSGAGSWVAKIFIALLAMSFGVWGINDVFRGPSGDALAQVGDREITAEEFRQAFDRQVRSYSRQLGQNLTQEQARQFGLDRQVLSQLMQDAALQAQADRMGLEIPNKAVADRIASNPDFRNARGQFDPDDFRRRLAANGFSEQQFVAIERQAMIRSAITEAIDEGLEAPQPLVEAVWKHRNELRDARYFVLRADPSSVPEPTDQELKAFYDANTGLFRVPERRSFAVIVADADTVGGKLEISDADIEAEYERNKSAYGTPEKRTIQQIAFPNAEEAAKASERIRAGADFLAVAKERGLTESDAMLGTFTREQVPDPALAEAAFKLAEGVVSDPVQGRLSTSLLRVTKIEPGSQKSLAEARDEVLKQLRHARGRDEVLNVHDKIEDARAGGQTFEETARTEGLPFRLIEGVDRTGIGADGKPLQDLPGKEEVLGAVFQGDVGVELDAVSTPNDGFVWVDIREVTPPSVKPLDQVRPEVVEAWKTRRQRELVVERANELKKRAESGTSLDQLARDSGAEVKTATGLKRSEANETFDAQAVAALFAAPPDGFAVAPEADGSGAKIMQSMPVMGTPYDPNSADAKEIAKTVSGSLANDLYVEYLTDLQNNLGVKLNEAEWSRLSGGRS